MGTELEGVSGAIPQKEGVVVKEQPADIRPFVDRHLSSKITLADLVNEGNIFFCHSALFVYGNWVRDPVADYVNTEDNECSPFWITFDSPIFSGLQFKNERRRTNSEWNYRLMACPMHSWPGLLRCLQSLSGVNRTERRFHLTVVQQIPMVDYFALAKKSTLPSPLPMIDVYTVGLLGNDKNVYFEPATNPPIDKVRIRTGPPLPQIIEEGEKVLAGETHSLSSPLLIPLEEDNAKPEVLASLVN